MVTIVAAIFMMGFFQEDTADALQHTIEQSAMLKIMLVGTAAALCFSLEATLIFWLLKRNVPGPDGAQLVLLFDGIYGLIMLAVLSVYGIGY